MPTTTSHRATPRQMSLLADLVRERATLTAAHPEIADAGDFITGDFHDYRTARGYIERLLAIPRPRPAGTPSSASADAERLQTPSFETRAGRMLHAGGIEATVSLPTGHVTVVVNSRRQVGRGWANCGPTDEGARTNISVLGQKRGWINVDRVTGNWFATFRTRNENVKRAVEEIFAYAAGLATDYPVREASRCGRCRRTLTDPVSIDRGIGPECFGRTTESHHANVRENASVAPAPRVVTGHLAPATLNSSQLRERTARIEQTLNAAADALTTPAPRSITELTQALETPAQVSSEVQRARDIIAEALDAYGESEAQFALSIFDRLARS